MTIARSREPTLRLTASDGTHRRTFTLRGARIGIGRASDNALVVHSASASRHHAQVERRADGWWLVPIQAVRLDPGGPPLDGAVRLAAGQGFLIGAIRFEPDPRDLEPAAGEPEPAAGEPEPAAGDPEPAAGEPEPAAAPVRGAVGPPRRSPMIRWVRRHAVLCAVGALGVVLVIVFLPRGSDRAEPATPGRVPLCQERIRVSDDTSTCEPPAACAREAEEQLAIARRLEKSRSGAEAPPQVLRAARRGRSAAERADGRADPKVRAQLETLVAETELALRNTCGEIEWEYDQARGNREKQREAKACRAMLLFFTDPGDPRNRWAHRCLRRLE